MCSCNLNTSSLSYSTCCCSSSSDDWKYQVTPNSRTRLTTDSTKLTINPDILVVSSHYCQKSTIGTGINLLVYKNINYMGH